MCSMLMMYLFGHEIAKCNYQTIRVLPHVGAVYALSQGICGAIVAATFSLICLLEVGLVYYFMKASGVLYAYMLRYMILNMFLPLLCSIHMGIVIGRLMKGRWKYPVTLIAWLFTCPFAAEASAYVFEAFKTQSRPLQYFFYTISLSRLSSIDTSSLYGVSLQSWQWNAMMIKTCFVISFALAMLLLQKRRQRIFTTLVASLAIIVISLLTYSETNLMLNSYYGYPRSKSMLYESTYYLNEGENKERYEFSDSVYLRLVKSTITVDVDDHLTFECFNEYIVTEYATQQSFTLYRYLDIDGILANGKETSFERYGDYVNVIFSDPLMKGETINIAFHYGGCTSPMFETGLYDICLPGSYPYMPQVGMIFPLTRSERIFAGSELYPLYGAESGEVEYDLTLNGTRYNTIFCNLPQVGSCHFQGTSGKGVTLISHPLMTAQDKEGIRFYCPCSALYAQDLLINIAKTAYSYYQKIFDDAMMPLENVVVVPYVPTIGSSKFTIRDAGTIYMYYQGAEELYNTFCVMTQYESEAESNGNILRILYDSVGSSEKFQLSFDRDPINMLIFGLFFDDRTEELGLLPEDYFGSMVLFYLTEDFREDQTLRELALSVYHDISSAPGSMDALFTLWLNECIENKIPFDAIFEEIEEMIHS